MNIIHCIPKIAGRQKKSFLSAGSCFLSRTFPVFMVLVLCFVLAGGWGIGVNKAYANSVEVWVSADEDDAEEADDGSIDLTSSDLELIRESSDQQVGMRFQNISIEQGAIINSAYIRFACDETGPTEITTITFYGQAHNNALSFSSSSNNISHRVKTGASVTWTISNQWATAHEYHQSPDLAPIIQEIVDRSGWESGNSLVIIVTGSGKRVAESYDGGGADYAPRLFIDYTGGSDKVATCRIYYRDNKQAQADSTTSLSVDAPSVSEGDLMIATVAFGNGGATLSAPGDWTPIEPNSPGVESLRTSAWYKIAGPSEPSTYDFSASGAADEMLVDIAAFYSSAGAAVIGWDVEDSSYNYLGSEDTVINSDKVRCVDSSLLYFAGSYQDAADVVSRPSGMTVLSEQKKTSGAQLLSLAAYYLKRDAGNNISKTIEWTSPSAFISALAAVFSCQASAEWIIDASTSTNGSISPVGHIGLPDGGSKTFAILPDPGYEIFDVVVDGTSKGALASYTFNNVKADHTIAATFKATGLFTITTGPGSNGSISPVGPVGVAPGANQTFSIIPDAGYMVDEVKVDGKKVKGPPTSYTFENVQDHHEISATFKVDTAAPPDDSCSDISDIPLDARFQSAPPNILIALDDSGSMSFEILVPGAIDGKYLDFHDYAFDNPCGDKFGSTPGCHEYNRGTILKRGEGRLHWKTQWAGFNKMWYDPTIDYEPWPLVDGRMDNADANNPRSHPMYASPTFDLSSSYDEVTIGSFEVYADDEDTAIFSKTGPSWHEATDSEAYKDHYWAGREKGSYNVVWTPYVPVGTYKVYARWRQLPDRSKDVPYTIVHAGGTDTVKVDQTSNGGNWYELGTYTFNSGIAEVSISTSLDKDNEKTFCADAIKFVPEGTWTVDIPRAHYYTQSATDGKPYLVLVDGGVMSYYEFNDGNADDVVDSDELLPAVSPPADVQTGRSYTEERQNFANWYSYYRRRGLAATYATAEVIVNMQAVRIGLYGINIGKSWTITQPVLNVKNDGEDYTETLLNLLYDFKFQGGTPLRQALEAGGQYFDKHDNKTLDGDKGDDSPWDSAADGGECQQAFTILITDGYYNGKDPKNVKGNIDGDNGVPYADSYDKTLADVAMYYYERDLNTDLADNVPPNPYDDATHQHMVTYTVGFGVVGAQNPDDFDEDLKNKDTGQYIVWPDPGKGNSTPEKVDDVWHAAVNGRGQFLNSANPKELVNSMNAIMTDIERRVFSSTGVAVNGDQLYQKLEPDLLMFQASYSSEGWTGEVKAFNVDQATGAVDTLNPEWSAAAMLNTKPWDNRIIATHNGTSGIPFRYDSLTDAQKGMIDPNYATDSTTAREIMDYLHGDTGNEERNGGTLRNRFYVLGDIVHSSPVFKNNIIYTGANDGMLHAFDVETGEELFAYVPNLVFANLSALADPLYEHSYYVDLTATIRDIPLLGINTTMLVGGLGKGGRGYFALDLTGLSPALGDRPTSESALDDRVMWEYPDAATPSAEVNDLGYSFSKPAVVKSNDPTYSSVVIFGNGYNSPNGNAVLFILDAASGDLLKRIDTGVGTCNGLSTPVAVDVDDDEKVDYVYAGDLKGNLWKFDLSDPDYTLWNVAYSDGGTPKPLFQTNSQPITTKPSVMYHCEKNGYLVAFGTGKYLGLEDLAAPPPDYKDAVYGIWDYGDDEDDSEYVGAFNGSLISDTYLPATVSLLQQIVVDERTAFGEVWRTQSAGQPDWQTTTLEGGSCGDNAGTDDCDPNDIPSVEPGPDPVRNAGWYFNLPESGERVVSDVRIRGGRLTVISYVASASTCGLSGHSWVAVLDPCTGGRLTEAYFDLNEDGKVDLQDLIDIGEPDKTAPTAFKIDGKVEMPTYLIDGDTEIMYLPKIDTTMNEKRGAAPSQEMTHWRVLRK